MSASRFFTCCFIWLAACLPVIVTAATPDADEAFSFDDQPLEEPLEFPDWFKLSFLDIRDDIREVREAGKSGLIVYFGQKYCAYCKAFLENDLELEDIRIYRGAEGEGLIASQGESAISQICLRGYTYFFIPWRRYRITLDATGATAFSLEEVGLDGSCWE